jgi:hypothetical protein
MSDALGRRRSSDDVRDAFDSDRTAAPLRSDGYHALRSPRPPSPFFATFLLFARRSISGDLSE